MDSNPDVQRPLQSENDPFQVSESLGRLQLDEPVDDDTSLSTPTRSTLPSTQSSVSISDKSLQELCEDLQVLVELVINSNYDAARLRRSLGTIWFNVNETLTEDPVLKTRLANQKEFQENVKIKGEKKFIELLKDTAKKKNWRDVLENRTSFLSSHLKRSDRVLSLAVFFKQVPSDESNFKSMWSEASENGAHWPSGHRTFR